MLKSPRKILLWNVTKTYEHTAVTAVRNLQLEVLENEILCLVGPSGCGKTTVINLVAGFINPTDGEVKVDGQQRECGVVFQTDSVFPWMTVHENIGYSLKTNGVNESQSTAVIKKYAHLVALDDALTRWPRDLSGGMRKRVELARTFARNPEILLFDEPFASLDVLTKEQMQLLLLEVWKKEKKTVLLVTHDPEEAVFLGHRVAIMTPQPSQIKTIIKIPFRMPRKPSLKLTAEFVKYRRKVVKALGVV